MYIVVLYSFCEDGISRKVNIFSRLGEYDISVALAVQRCGYKQQI